MKLTARSFALAVTASIARAAPAFACDPPASVCFEPSETSFSLIANGRPAAVLVDANADSAVARVGDAFAADLRRVSGRRARQVSSANRVRGPVVVIGVASQSEAIDSLVADGKLDLANLENSPEGFEIEVVDNPWPNVERALVIAGADRRGAVFGAYDVAEEMGVSPWHWFADVPVVERDTVFVTAGRRREAPGIRYRGFFINDEDPAFSSWAEDRFGGINADMYEHVFELLLRMKGNYIWPAMWAPKAFHLDDPNNADLAHEMGVVMGTSHHEPLSRAQAEWHRLDEDYMGGDWNYQINAENLRRFWRDGLERMMEVKGGRDNLLTIGMRGDGDAPMAEGTAIDLLKTVVADQREIIADVTGKPASKTPQVWALYKEVQDYYDDGMTVPDDVTLLFADDNWGQIRRLPTKDVEREGGFGVYYHFDYVGVPRNYKWLNTTQVEKVWQQMNLAYERGARDVWIVNVGDIKPMEYPLDFFMEMAWAPGEMTTDGLAAYPKRWAAQQFGEELAEPIGDLMTRYSKLAAMRKPELVNEDTYATGEIRSDVLVRGEWSSIVEPWRALVSNMEVTKEDLPEEHKEAFYQLIEFPILAVSNLYELYFATAWNRALAARFDPRGNYFKTKADEAFARDGQLTEEYHSRNGGKWNHMMSQVHMNYVIWNDPSQQTQPPVVWTAGDVPEKMRDVEPVFVDAVPSDTVISFDAADFDRSVSAGGIAWTPVSNLGQGKAGLVGLPQGQLSSEAGAGPRVEYEWSLAEEADQLSVQLALLPTLNTKGDQPLRIGISLDDGAVQVLEMNLEPTGGAQDTPAKRRWADAVVENGVTLSAEFGDVAAGGHTLHVWRIDDNVIVDTVSLHAR